MLSALSSYLKKIFYLDLRSLGLFRIGLGWMTLLNCFTLYPHINSFFGPHGLAVYSDGKLGDWSFFAINTSPAFLTFVFMAHAVFGLMLLVGYKSRLATILCFVMTISFTHRLPITNFGGDAVMTVCLLWAIFLPLGAHFSIDSLTNKSKTNVPNQFLSLGTIALFAQLFIIYIFNTIARDHPVWNSNYTALFYALSNVDVQKPLALWALQYPDMLKGLTFLVYTLELYGLFLLLIPMASFFRSLVIIVFVLMHIGIDLTINASWFLGIMLTLWAAFIPSSWWNVFHPTVKEPLAPDMKFDAKSDIFILSLLMYVFVTNCRFLHIEGYKKPAWKENYLESIGKKLGIYQKWKLYAPRPNENNRTYYFYPEFGTDDRKGQPVKITTRSARWRVVLLSLRVPKFYHYYVALEKHIIHAWNATHPRKEHISSAHIFFSQEDIALPGQPRSPKKYYDFLWRPLHIKETDVLNASTFELK